MRAVSPCYASVWAVVEGFPDGSPENASGNWLQMADLQRITAHYGQSHDIFFYSGGPMNRDLACCHDR